MGNLNKRPSQHVRHRSVSSVVSEFSGIHLPTSEDFEAERRSKYGLIVSYWGRLSLSEDDILNDSILSSSSSPSSPSSPSSFSEPSSMPSSLPPHLPLSDEKSKIKEQQQQQSQQQQQRSSRVAIAVQYLKEYPTDLIELITTFIPYFLNNNQSWILHSNLLFHNQPLYTQFPKPSFDIITEGPKQKQMQQLKRVKSIKHTESLIDSQNACNIIILGTHKSGKQTLFKQFNEIYNPDRDKFYKSHERQNQHNIHEIAQQILEDLKKLVDYCSQVYERQIMDHSITDEDTYFALRSFLEPLDEQYKLTSERIQQCKTVWNYTYIQELFREKRHELGVYDSLAYYLQEIDRLFINDRHNWNINDRLLVRSFVAGVTRFEFDMNVVYNHMWLCGGQRQERKKWDHWASSTDVIIWVVSLTSYQEVTEANQNAMLDALETFDIIVNRPQYTEEKLWLVLFNHMDLFEQELYNKDLSSVFKDFNGQPMDLKENLMFIMQKFAACIPSNIHKHTMFVFDYISMIDCIQVKQWIERTWPIVYKFVRAKHKR